MRGWVDNTALQSPRRMAEERYEHVQQHGLRPLVLNAVGRNCRMPFSVRSAKLQRSGMGRAGRDGGSGYAELWRRRTPRSQRRCSSAVNLRHFILLPFAACGEDECCIRVPPTERRRRRRSHCYAGHNVCRRWEEVRGQFSSSLVGEATLTPEF